MNLMKTLSEMDKEGEVSEWIISISVMRLNI